MEKTLDVPIFRVSRLITTDNFDNLYKEVKGQGVSVSALLAKAVAMTLERVSKFSPVLSRGRGTTM